MDLVEGQAVKPGLTMINICRILMPIGDLRAWSAAETPHIREPSP